MQSTAGSFSAGTQLAVTTSLSLQQPQKDALVNATVGEIHVDIFVSVVEVYIIIFGSGDFALEAFLDVCVSNILPRSMHLRQTLRGKRCGSHTISGPAQTIVLQSALFSLKKPRMTAQSTDVSSHCGLDTG